MGGQSFGGELPEVPIVGRKWTKNRRKWPIRIERAQVVPLAQVQTRANPHQAPGGLGKTRPAVRSGSESAQLERASLNDHCSNQAVTGPFYEERGGHARAVPKNQLRPQAPGA